MVTRLSEHFTLEEFTFSQTAVRRGIDNTPPAAILERLKIAAEKMERVRHVLGGPIRVSSAYRSLALNKAVKGSKTSAHCLGWAVDFTCPSLGSPLAICRTLEKHIHYDQLIHEFGSWVHISFDPQGRNMELTIDKLGTRPGIWTIRK
jgi:hypothetical protein